MLNLLLCDDTVLLRAAFKRRLLSTESIQELYICVNYLNQAYFEANGQLTQQICLCLKLRIAIQETKMKQIYSEYSNVCKAFVIPMVFEAPKSKSALQIVCKWCEQFMIQLFNVTFRMINYARRWWTIQTRISTREKHTFVRKQILSFRTFIPSRLSVIWTSLEISSRKWTNTVCITIIKPHSTVKSYRGIRTCWNLMIVRNSSMD